METETVVTLHVTRDEVLRWKRAVSNLCVGVCVGALVFLVLHMRATAGSIASVASEFMAIMLCMAGMYGAGILYCTRRILGYRNPALGRR